MPRSAAAFISNNFSRGLITEATGLNFPENACTDAENCVFDWTGEVSRRLGIDYELNFANTSISKSQLAISTYMWKNVSGNGNITLFVAQIGTTIYFWDIAAAGTPSNGFLTSNISLSGISGSPSLTNIECQFTSGSGYLFVTHPYMDPVYITYSGSGTSATVASTTITLQIRDFAGQPDTVTSVTQRPSSLSTPHNYNLLNQGWTDGSHGDVTSTNFIGTWHSDESNYPSNADVWFIYKDSTNVFNPTTMSPNVIPGNSRAATGHFIGPAFNFDPDVASGLTGLTVSSSGVQRPSCCAFFAGRVFYSGVGATGYSSNIYFSNINQQTIIPTTTTWGQCYQVNDPTSEDDFDLEPDDGGVLVIQDAGTIIRMWAMTGGLAVFATNGIWLITGSVGIGFTASDYTIRHISSINAISASSFVDIAGYPAWWNYEGMYILQGSQLDLVQVQSLTNTTIRTFYQGIPATSKKYSRGAFNVVTSEAWWLFSSTSPTDTTTSFQFDSILVLNLLTGSFSPWKVDTTAGPKICAVQVFNVTGGLAIENDIVSGSGATVLDAAGDTVGQFVLTNTSTEPEFAFFTSSTVSGNNEFTFSEVSNTSFLDWKTYNGVGADAPAYFVSGYRVHGNAQNKFTTNYLYLYSDHVPSQFTVLSRWNYSINSGSGKWSTSQTVRNLDTNYDVAKYRLKIPGEGVACQFQINSIAGQDLGLIGWSSYDTGNSQP